jgi:DNA repair protein RecO (recombination protein O)
MFIKTEGIVISTIKYRDTDLIVKCYTKSHGSISFMVKGILKSKRGKFRSSMFQILSLIGIEMQYKNKGQLEYFKEVQTTFPLNDLQGNVYKSTIAMFIAEILKSVIFEEEQNINLFEFIKKSIIYLDTTNNFANFHLSFLIKLSAFIGFSPHLPENDIDLYFNLSEGYFENKESKFSMSAENSNLLKQLIEIDLQQSYRIKLNKVKRLELLKLLITYYELHIESFKKPKSLEVIESVFT